MVSRGMPNQTALNTEGFVYEINDELFQGDIPETIEQFKKFIHDEQAKLTHLPMRKRTPLYIGATCLQGLIRAKINALPSTQALANRLNYFNSKDFLDNFCVKIKSITKYGDKGSLDGSYTNFFNVLFNTKFKGLRASGLALPGNPVQCNTVLGKSKPTNDGLQKDDPCYICGRAITFGVGINTMECEHILGITTALTNWWLVRTNNNRENKKALSYEYKWSHQCCNQKKANYDFIQYTPSKRNDYVVNDKLVYDLLTDIKSADSYDCQAIKGEFDVNARVKSINKLLQPIVEELNLIHEKFDNHDEYLLLTKFKLVSALTDRALDALIIGSGSATLSKKQKQKNILLAKKAKQAEDEATQAKQKIINTKQLKAKRAESLARRTANKGLGGGAAAEDDTDSNEDAVANVILFDDNEIYIPTLEDLKTEYRKIYGMSHTHHNSDGTTTVHFREQSTPGTIIIRPPYVDATHLSPRERLKRGQANESWYSGNKPFGASGANKKKRRRSKNATRKMNMKGKKAVKKRTRKKRTRKKRNSKKI